MSAQRLPKRSFCRLPRQITSATPVSGPQCEGSLTGSLKMPPSTMAPAAERWRPSAPGFGSDRQGNANRRGNAEKKHWTSKIREGKLQTTEMQCGPSRRLRLKATATKAVSSSSPSFKSSIRNAKFCHGSSDPAPPQTQQQEDKEEQQHLTDSD